MMICVRSTHATKWPKDQLYLTLPYLHHRNKGIILTPYKDPARPCEAGKTERLRDPSASVGGPIYT